MRNAFCLEDCEWLHSYFKGLGILLKLKNLSDYMKILGLDSFGAKRPNNSVRKWITE